MHVAPVRQYETLMLNLSYRSPNIRTHVPVDVSIWQKTSEPSEIMLIFPYIIHHRGAIVHADVVPLLEARWQTPAPLYFSRHICSSRGPPPPPPSPPRWPWRCRRGSRTCLRSAPSSSWWDPAADPQPGWRSVRWKRSSQSTGFCAKANADQESPDDSPGSLNILYCAARLPSVPTKGVSSRISCTWRQIFAPGRRRNQADISMQTLANNAATAFLTNSGGRGSEMNPNIPVLLCQVSRFFFAHCSLIH